MTKKPNILMIMADQLAAQALAAYGNTVCKTPHLDALAERGSVFDNCYCNYPLCVPSRASMIAGRLTPAIGVWDNACELASSQPTMAHHLRHLGYRTILTGKMHFIGPDQMHGFEERLVTDVYPADFDWVADWTAGASFVPSATAMNGVVEAGTAVRTMQEDYDEEVGHCAVQAIYDLARDDGNRPWFQLASFTSPHTPFVASRQYWERYSPNEIDEPAVPELPFAELDYASRALFFAHGRHRHTVTRDHLMAARHAYYAMISFIDDKVGELLEALERTGQTNDTTVLFCSDHGEMLGERGMWFKQSLYDWSARIPLIAAGPGVASGHRIGEVVSLVDLLPTLVELAGGRVSLACDGESLKDALAGGPGRDLAICDYTGIGPCVPTRMVRAGSHKLIYTHGHPHLLFDLKADPDERNNLADDPACRVVLERLLNICFEDWDPAIIDIRVRESQRQRLFLKHTPGDVPDWTFIARAGDRNRYVRRGTGGVDGTKSRLRIPFVAPVEPDLPELSREEIEQSLRDGVNRTLLQTK